MKKKILLALIILVFLGVGNFLLPAESLSRDVDVHIGIGISVPPPAVIIPAPPAVFLIPGPYVYFAPDVGLQLFFYSGYWYPLHNGYWFKRINDSTQKIDIGQRSFSSGKNYPYECK